MKDDELCEMFGTTPAEVEEDVTRIERGEWGPLGDVVEGMPSPQMKTAAFRLYDFELAAIDRAAAREGISRSAFIRRACDNELVAMA